MSTNSIADLKNAWEKMCVKKNRANGDMIFPTMVLSVIEDSDSFAPRTWPNTMFQTALIEAAKSGGETWIFYHRNDHLVSRTISDAYQIYKDMNYGTDNSTDDYIRLINVGGEADTVRDDHEYESEYIDNVYVTDMLEFEKFVSDQNVCFSEEMGFGMPIPMAIILCVGDLESINHITLALKSKLPVIIMKGSGMAADLILTYLESPEQLDVEASAIFGIDVEDENYKKLETDLQSISENKKLVRVFDLDSDNPLRLSSIIGEAIVNSWSSRRKLPCKDLTISASTSQSSTCDSIRLEKTVINEFLSGLKNKSLRYVFNPQFTSPKSHPLIYFRYQLLQTLNAIRQFGEDLLLEALIANQCDYVKALLDQEVKFENSLQKLYKQKFDEKDANMLCQPSLCSPDIENPTSECIIAEAARKLCGKILEYDLKGEAEETHRDASNLLLWAVFANRKELAEIFWLRSCDQIFTGLVCSVLLRKLSEKAKFVPDLILSNELAEHAELFEQRSICIMDKMYEENINSADVLDEVTCLWGISSSPLSFAYENEMYNVIAHLCTQKTLIKKWHLVQPHDNSASKKSMKCPLFPHGVPVKYRFLLYYVMLFAVLMMYSYFVLTSIHTTYYVQDSSRFLEYFVYLWSFGDAVDEIIIFVEKMMSVNRFKRNKSVRLRRYVNNFWNWIDFLYCYLLAAALLFRHFYPSETFTIARRLFSLSLLVMFLRFLKINLVHEKMASTLIMFREMIKDLFRFLLIAFYVILGVGIYYHANIFPDHQTIWGGDWTDWRIWKIIYYPYWQMYAELNLEYIEGKIEDPTECTNVTAEWEAGIKDRCPQKDWTVLAITGVYLLVSNLILVNLVIAKFSYTFERVQENSEKLYWYEVCAVTYEFKRRIPSPFNLIVFAYCLCDKTIEFMKKCRKNKVSAVESSVERPDAKVDKTSMTKAAVYKRVQKIIAYRIATSKIR